MGVAAAIALGQIGDAGKLRGFENAVRHAQPAHVGILVRRHVEQAEEPPAEIVGRLGIDVLGGVLLQPLVGVERMLLALELLRVRQLAAGLEHAVLRLERGGIGTDRLRRGRSERPRQPGGRAGEALCRLGDLQTGGKALQIALLFGLEVAGCRCARQLEIDAGFRRHSAGTCVGMVSGATALRGLCVM